MRMMKILLLHQNFPGQFRQLAPYLASHGHDLTAVCSHDRPLPEIPSLRLLRYKEPAKIEVSLPFGSQVWHEALQRAELLGLILLQLKSEGYTPDCVLVHCGWGEALPVKEIWPNTPLIIWPELWLKPEHMGFGIDPLKGPVTPSVYLSNLGRNSLTEASLAQADAWVLPTNHQAASFPSAYQDTRMHIIHEGIDTRIACPNERVCFEVRGKKIDRAMPILTLVNRNLERLRGFDTFMYSLPKILAENKDVRVFIVGDNEGGYGGAQSSGQCLRDLIMHQLEGQLDIDRVYFLGRIPYPHLISLLQSSWVHVYLSYPFIMGWSLLEAMSCGCCIIGSKGMPVEEVITDGVNGLLVDVKDHQKLADRVLALIANSKFRAELGSAARKASLEWDQEIMLPKSLKLIESIVKM